MMTADLSRQTPTRLKEGEFIVRPTSRPTFYTNWFAFVGEDYSQMPARHLVGYRLWQPVERCESLDEAVQ